LETHIDKSSEDIAEPCSMFPDHGGETLLRILGFIPLLELVSEHVKFTAFLGKHTPLDGKHSMVEFQRDRLFSKSTFARGNKFPKDKNFTDYALRNEYIETLKDDFKTRESILLEQMQLIANMLKDKPTISNNNALKMGIQFWDVKRDAKQRNDKKTQDMFASFISAFADNIGNSQSKDISTSMIEE